MSAQGPANTTHTTDFESLLFDTLSTSLIEDIR